ncbi:hypothetical protein P280DRAFT_539049 [Massarina eburnea CBS 473.64]|uniref:Uncharacterized protein n=1 Tax=Massarina eburnea CBS 473.64 TaxID=1395130 RepID=A0A6A6S7E4_9PLEO|nr:hypothetical protein P280DRAFT_539049 [Massarina eburnea CBS 473.64]
MRLLLFLLTFITAILGATIPDSDILKNDSSIAGDWLESNSTDVGGIAILSPTLELGNGDDKNHLGLTPKQEAHRREVYRICRGNRKICKASIKFFNNENFGGKQYYWGTDDMIWEFNAAPCVAIAFGASSIWLEERKDRGRWGCKIWDHLGCKGYSIAGASSASCGRDW